jgi:acid phosphatase
MTMTNRTLSGAMGVLLLATDCASRAPARVTAPSPPPAGHENLNAVAWVQTAAEFEGLARQAYAAARAGLARGLADPAWSAVVEQPAPAPGLPPAIVVDVDETVLDNVVFQVRLILSGREYSEPVWREWVEERKAAALPGAVEFLSEADATGVTVFYVTNREAASESATRENLARLGFPLDRGGRDTVLCRGERPEWAGTDKSTRRGEVAREYRVLLLVGDDLGDFIGAGGLPAERAQRAAAYATWWGSRWIALPNPMYGSWERAVMAPAPGLPDDPAARKRARLQP